MTASLRGGKASLDGQAAILKAIDDEHHDLVKAAQAIYTERMKAARADLEANRRAWERAQSVFTAAEVTHDGERRANLEEAQRRRTELRQAVTGTRPVKMANVDKISRTPAGGGKPVSLPRLRCLEERASS